MRRRMAGAVAVAILTATAGCSSHDAPGRGATSRSARSSSTASVSPTGSKEDLLRRAELALTPAGAEVRVMHGSGAVAPGRSGIIIEPKLTQGRLYELQVACMGHGALGLYWETRTPHSGLVPVVGCDGKSVTYPFTGGDLVEMDIRASVDAKMPMVAWQILAKPGR